MMRRLGMAWVCWTFAVGAFAKDLPFVGDLRSDDAALPQAMLALAKQVIPAYQDDDRGRYLDNLFRLQLVAGQYADATQALKALHALHPNPANLQYAVLATAKQHGEGAAFEKAFGQAFREVIGPLDDRTSAQALRAFNVDRTGLDKTLQDELAKHKGQSVVSLADALSLVRAYQVDQARHVVAPLLPPLVAEDDQRRYIIERDVKIKTPDGATLCAMVVRPRSASLRVPTMSEFTIYVPLMGELRRAASNGYAGVEGFTRGKQCSPDAPVPYEHDSSDAATVIDWISAQPWSDGRVGMYGGSYNGFAQWATAKRMPKALKALMPSAPAAPGIDAPMEGNVVQSWVYPWPLYTTNSKALDSATYNDAKHWNKLNHDWYSSGRPYRDLDKVDGTPNPIFDKWLDHPSYDSYWQGLIPYQAEFARINIPVLATAGYFGGGPGAASYYFTEHYKYVPRAEHYLVIGPYSHFVAQIGTIDDLGRTSPVLEGYSLDPAAQIDIGELRVQWFDYIFRAGPKPVLLKDKVNYEVMGANEWKHAPSFASMANSSQRFHLSAVRSGNSYQLTERKPADAAYIAQAIDFADRSDVERVVPGGEIVDKAVDTWNALEFMSAPLTKPTEVSGLFSAQLDFTTNKKDFDFNVGLYELTPAGEYFQLSYYLARASYVRDLTHRRLLIPGKRQRLEFKSSRLTSRLVQPGSRLVVVLSVLKQPDIQINYGTGRDVSSESIADAKDPLTIQWFGDSFIDLPIQK